MAPGPKKKGLHRRNPGDSQQDNKNVTKKYETQEVEINRDEILNSYDIKDNMYKKRSIKSNWDRYEEPPVDPHADQMRGNDFGVALSYSGGSGSQLQLQNEKDWDDAYVDDNNIALDLKNLVQSMKCIPFHERIHLSKDIFDKEQISKFFSSAEYWGKSNKPNLDVPLENKPVDLESHLNIVESPESSSDSLEMVFKPQTIESKTGSIIESLTSSLSLKSQEKEEIPKLNIVEDSSKECDDLDFLLSLNVSLNETKSMVNEPKSDVSKISVDDWLNSLLD